MKIGGPNFESPSATLFASLQQYQEEHWGVRFSDEKEFCLCVPFEKGTV